MNTSQRHRNRKKYPGKKPITLVDQTLNKINQHWKHEEFTPKNLEEELNNISRSWMKSIKGVNETNILKKISNWAFWTCIALTFLLLVVNIGFYADNLVIRVKLGNQLIFKSSNN